MHSRVLDLLASNGALAAANVYRHLERRGNEALHSEALAGKPRQYGGKRQAND